MDAEVAASKRAKVCREVLATTPTPKSSLATILEKLNAEGLLVPGAVPEGCNMRKEVAKAFEFETRPTPFGPCLQKKDMQGFMWTFLNPFAFLYLLCQVQPLFRDAIRDCVRAAKGTALRVVLFVDEFRPGNVLRPDKARATQNIFWVFADLPDYLLCRSEVWLQFGAIRSKILADRGITQSALMKEVLLTFFSNDAPNFFVEGVGVIDAAFAGFIGDEKGMKELFSGKGPGGTRPCLSCRNVVQWLPTTDYLVGIDGAPEKFDPATDSDVWRMADRIKQLAATAPKKDLELLQQASGLTYDASGVLFSDACRSLVRPVKGWFRDWMHIFCVGGIANLEIQQLLNALREQGVQPKVITAFFEEITLPSMHGVIQAEWLTVSRLGKPAEDRDGWKGFAGEVLTMVQLLAFFLELAVVPLGILPEHCKCFLLLARLMRLLSVGTDKPAQHSALMGRLLDQHADLFRRLYPDVIKPKYHHAFHLKDHLSSLGKLLSCWSLERKHRTTKKYASQTFAHYEVTLGKDLLNRAAVIFEDGGLFARSSLESPVNKSCFGVNILMARAARLPCGTVRSGDLVFLVNGLAGFVISFASLTGEGVTCSVNVHKAIAPLILSRDTIGMQTFDANDIDSAVGWCRKGGNIRVMPPPSSAIVG